MGGGVYRDHDLLHRDGKVVFEFVPPWDTAAATVSSGGVSVTGGVTVISPSRISGVLQCHRDMFPLARR